ncbi:type I polyketide synthase [Neorhodopirellula pilleata]|uniref:Polyketide synthase PksN n=1 Tax=Neorhodopirellula pilleata TaxID=2714738 RepID=A0A5C6ATL4_9BACT|nr:beta-ketoacyl synthase N-terminal-like domain-containing protein [Neorhodopirellula pilleata]TWU03335.1 Polyketide synthase PksN [Neorhodopirellula pilleata]
MIQLPPPDDSRSIDINNVLETLRKTKAGMQRVHERLSEPLAVIGMGCRFPGAANPDEYWDLLHQGRSVETASGDRWDESLQAEHEKQPGRITANRTGWLDAIDQFDAGFFGITGREAATLDPQQRLLLEIAWETFENAGIVPAKSRGQRIGAFVGICSNDYLYRLNRRDFSSIDTYLSTGNAHGAAAGRLSYVMDWRGPSVAIDTACSSSLTALHLATRSLRYGDCDMAIAMGVNVILAPELSISFSQAGMLSSTGRCHTFSSNADGFVRGEGCGAVLLKRLRDAVRDGDTIHCVVRGTAVNQDGRSVGLTAPNGNAQQAVIREAINDASLTPDQIDYIEAHGTGTPLGDPVEVDALRQVFANSRRPDQPLKIGSVKTNMGHLEGAAGIAGVLKVVLSIKHNAIPAHLHCDAPSPSIDWQWPVEITTHAQRWSSKMRVAGVSSFGFGGSNAHVILSDAPVSNPLSPGATRPDTISGEFVKHDSETSPESLFVLSAKSPKALREYAQRFADKFSRVPERLVDICYSAATTREVFEHRVAFVVESTTDLVMKLNAFASGQTSMPEISMPTSRGSLISVTSPTLSALADAFMRGDTIDWASVFEPTSKRIDLPTYPFQRTQRWMDELPVKLPASSSAIRTTKDASLGILADHPMLDRKLDTAGDETIFEVELNRLEYLGDHVVRGNILFPAAGMVELTLAAMASVGEPKCTIESMRLLRPIVVRKNQACTVQIIVAPVDEEASGCRRVRIAMRDGSGWTKVAQAEVGIAGRIRGGDFQSPTPQVLSQRHVDAPILTTQTLMDQCDGVPVHATEHYASMRHHGLDYGPAFAGLRNRTASADGNVCWGEACLPDAVDANGYRFHPAWMDSCFQVAASVIPDVDRTWVPVGFDSIEFCREPADHEILTVVATRRAAVDGDINQDDELSIGLIIQDENDQAVARIEAMHLKPIQIRTSDASVLEADLDEVREDPDLLREFLHHRIASIMGLELNEVPLKKSLDALGLDSLMAFELRDEMQSQFQIEIPLEMFFEAISLETFLDRILQQIAEAGPRAEQSDDWVEGAL